MEVILKNYRCFRDATLRLSPLTVLVGANASGKSTLARVLNPGVVIEPNDAWQGREELSKEIVRRFDNGSTQRTTLSQGHSLRHDWTGPASSLAYQMLVLNVDSLRGANTLAKQTRLDYDGSNLTNVFGTLTRVQQAVLSKQYCSLVPVYSDVDTDPQSSGNHTLRFQDRWNSARWYSPNEVSDGSLFILAFLLLAHQTPPVDILVIEDVEHGLHPFLLEEIVGLLRKLATGELTGRPMRVVLTTHSPTVVNFAKVEEVRFLNRQKGGSVEIVEVPADTEHWRAAFATYGESLGDAWLSGGLGGTP